MPQPFILASRSPRRKKLLTNAGYKFEVVPADEKVETPRRKNETALQYVMRMAQAKVLNVYAAKREENPHCTPTIVGCDTVAVVPLRIKDEIYGGEINKDEIFGKPKDAADAKVMLQTLRGKEHFVVSCLCILQGGILKTRIAKTQMKMDDISDEQIDEYIATKKWRGKAGAFGYQDGNDWVHIIEGPESNVVGLPMELLANTLQ